jgi:cardiolipin synthase A/B
MSQLRALSANRLNRAARQRTLRNCQVADNPSYTSPLSVPFPSVEARRLHWPLGSANLTSRVMESNLECGILIRGDPQPKAIRDHIAGLYASGKLRRL